MKHLKLGSLFDGSGGFPLAGALNGIEPVWASEVEPYPIAVTTSRFPHMKHLGDVSKVNGAEIEPVDIITFGSPCQDMSVAGKRAGIKHDEHGDEETTRSGLFYEAIRIIKEMRYGTEGRSPTFVVWENVPGAFSSNRGEDFRTVLEELVKIAEPTAVVPDVPQGGWAYADYWRGDGWSLAYRVFDAQYIRTAQRRKRIYLVLCLGDEDGAGKILFERDSLRGYFEEGRTAWEEAPSHAERSVGAADCPLRDGGGERTISLNWQAAVGAGLCVEEELVNPLACTRVPAIVEAVTDRLVLDDQGGSQISGGNGDGQTVNTITGDHENRITDYTSVVVEPTVALKGNGQRPSHHGDGYIVSDKSYTLNTTEVHGVVYAMDRASFNQGQNAQYDFEITDSGVNSTLVAKGQSAVCYGISSKQQSLATTNNIANTLGANDFKEPQAVCYENTYQEKTGPLMANTHPGSYSGQDAYNDMFVVGETTPPPRYIVRRLTPTECARLQGFPDRWGDIDHKETMTDEEFAFWLEVRQTYDRINGRQTKDYTEKQILAWYNKLHNDGAEYKMWGNGIALPCALYVMEGIVEVAT